MPGSISATMPTLAHVIGAATAIGPDRRGSADLGAWKTTTTSPVEEHNAEAEEFVKSWRCNA